jgi:hypothetical protein
MAKEVLIVDNDEIILAGVGDVLGDAGFIEERTKGSGKDKGVESFVD